MEINIIVVKDDWKIVVNKFFIEKLSNNSISIGTTVEEKDANVKLVKDNSLFKIEVSNSFILNHYATQSSDYINLVNELKNIFNIISEKSDEIVKQFESFSSVSIVYKYKTKSLHFPFNFLSSNYIKAFESALYEIYNLINKRSFSFEKQIDDCFETGDNSRVFSYQSEQWKIVNPLEEATDQTNKKYRENKDTRIKKPHIIVNKHNIWKYFIFETNWVLVFDKLETLLVQPNDVSLYSNIAEKNLNEAEQFYNKHITPRHKIYHGSYPSEKTQTEYFDYFELIIQAVIFSYTSLEAFANICIPENYTYTTEKEGIKTTYSKEAIERKFTLRDKFKFILHEILLSEDITRTKWWNPFIELEDIRNEIIHSKPSKSEDRYSRLLEKKIFKIIKIHKSVIEYYGALISENRKSLLNEFPYNFGYDSVSPGLMSDKEYDKSHRIMNNVKM